jgi:hypothetical protein
MKITAPISAGELYDKITILVIKATRMVDPEKLKNVRAELEALHEVAPVPNPEIYDEVIALKKVNEKLWDIEDSVRALENNQSFGEAFVILAREVYKQNDERSRLKRAISLKLGSAIIEEKDYQGY